MYKILIGSLVLLLSFLFILNSCKRESTTNIYYQQPQPQAQPETQPPSSTKSSGGTSGGGTAPAAAPSGGGGGGGGGRSGAGQAAAMHRAVAAPIRRGGAVYRHNHPI